MSEYLKHIRRNYQRQQERHQQKEFGYSRELLDNISKYRVLALQQKQRLASTNDFANFDEAQFYVDRYSEMEKLLQDDKAKKLNTADKEARLNKIFENKAQKKGGEVSVSQQPGGQDQELRQSRARDGVSPGKAKLNQFFNSKTQESKKQTNFSQLLDNRVPDLPSFKKKRNENKEQLNKLLAQKQSLIQRINREKINSVNASQLSRQYEEMRLKIMKLQQQNERLSHQNSSLKSTPSSRSTVLPPQDDYLYSPYHITPQRNDIYLLNLRHFPSTEQETFSGPEPVVHYVNKKVPLQYDTYTQEDEHRDRENQNYSVFDLNRTMISETEAYVDKNSGFPAEKQKNVIRNKLAFFKPQGILLKTNQLEIGFKRSEPERLNGLTTVRVILYFNNKTSQPQKLNTFYKCDPVLNAVKIIQQKELLLHGQTRQVLEVRLTDNQKQLTAIQAEVEFARGMHNIFLPVGFFRVVRAQSIVKTGSYRVLQPFFPYPAYKSPAEAAKTIPNFTVVDSQQGEFGFEAPFEKGLVKMRWKSDGRITMETLQNWLDFFSFLIKDTF